jgi:hypothetical protein
MDTAVTVFNPDPETTAEVVALATVEEPITEVGF